MVITAESAGHFLPDVAEGDTRRSAFINCLNACTNLLVPCIINVADPAGFIGFRFEGSEVLIHRVGDAVVLLPKNGNWQALLESLDRFPDDFMEERQQPCHQNRASMGSG